MKHLFLAIALSVSSPAVFALSGTITDNLGNPLENARIKIIDSGLELRTNAAGKFNHELKTIDELHIDAAGYSHTVLHLHGKSAENLNIVLQRAVIDEVEVIGLPLHLSKMESAQPISVVSGETLRNKQASTLGETLKNEVGVQSTYFGPVSSSPIIRGLDGPRVLITQNGLDAGDASRVGPDHVVATEASTAQQIEILRGPATLFYGSGAIGGVVNIVDDRVPNSSATKGAFSLGHNSVADEEEISAAYTTGSKSIAVHVDGFWRDSGDYKIPGFAELESEEEHIEEAHEEHVKGVLPNSAAESQGFNIGGSLLLDSGFVGISYGRLDRLNGLPGHSHEGERVLSDLAQNRWQLISDLNIDGDFISAIKTRVGFTNYQHREIIDLTAPLPEGEIPEVGTVFDNQTLQTRVDLTHQEIDRWRGALSVEFKQSDFKAVGEEAFTSPSTTDAFAIAMMEEKHLGNWLLQLGARAEQVQLNAESIELEQHHDGSEPALETIDFDKMEFHPFSLSTGVVWDFTTGYKVSASLAHSQRAPTAAELFSVGPHAGTATYEIGGLFNIAQEADEVNLEYAGKAKPEVANNIDLSLRKHHGKVGFVITAFYNQIDDFYYQRYTGLTSDQLLHHDEMIDPMAPSEHEHESDLPVTIFEQHDASFYGMETELAWQVNDQLKWTLWSDSIHGELSGGAYIPRIPPKRLGNQFHFERNQWLGEISIAHYFDQDNIATYETNTKGYTLIDAQLSYRIDHKTGALTLFSKIDNLTDEEARVHSSFLKNAAPLPGRGFSIGLRGSF